MKSIKNVAILGAGAMGALYATKFIDAGEFSVSLIARNPRFEMLKRNGLIVNGKHYSIPVIQPSEIVAPYDLILVALKNFHLPYAVYDLKNAVGDNTIIISVMNGLDSEEVIGSAYGMDKVLLAIAVGMDAVREGNDVVYSTPGKVCFGEANNTTPSNKIERVRDAFQRAGINCEVPIDMVRTMWWKFMINVGINQASAVMRVPYGVFQSSPDAKTLMDLLIHEVLVLARHSGVNLGEKDLADWYSVLQTLSPEGKTSMLQDIEAGRKTEVESFASKVVSMGQKLGVPTPVNLAVLSIIKVLERK